MVARPHDTVLLKVDVGDLCLKVTGRSESLLMNLSSSPVAPLTIANSF